jgi:hypothetical protein
MDTTLRVTEVSVNETRNGNRRYVLRADDGSEYTTFRPNVGEKARGLEGRRARVQFHEEDRNGFRNVYLDAIEAAEEETPQAKAGADTDPAEVAWRTAIEAAPYLVDDSDKASDPDELFDKLKPFKDRVVEDIREESGEA